jgi:hypothetical protein
MSKVQKNIENQLFIFNLINALEAIRLNRVETDEYLFFNIYGLQFPIELIQLGRICFLCQKPSWGLDCTAILYDQESTSLKSCKFNKLYQKLNARQIFLSDMLFLT